MRSPLALGLLAASVASAFAQSAQPITLKVGDAAPKLAVEKWVRGTPIKDFEAGKVYVVEFWATWCGPCIQSMPHLSDLAEKFKDKAQFVGVNVWDRQDDEKTAGNAKFMTRIDEFMKSKSKEMRYDVAIDDHNDTISKTWLFAAGQNGIPASFIVGREGKIEWIGHPMELDKPLEQIIDGTFDKAAYLKEMEVRAEAAKKARAAQDAWSKKLTAAAEANDIAAFEVEVAKGPNGDRPAPADYAASVVSNTYPTFALKYVEKQMAAGVISGVNAAQIGSFIIRSPKADATVKTSALALIEKGVAAAKPEEKAIALGMQARALAWAEKGAQAREALKSARAALKDAPAEQKDGLSGFLDSVEKMIKD